MDAARPVEWVQGDASHYERLAEVLDALPERVVRYRLPDLTIVYCNTSWAAWYDLAPAVVVGRPLDGFLSDDGRAGLNLQLARLSHADPILVDPVAREAPNAPGRWVEWVDRYFAGADGDEILAVGRDVTARHIAEMRLAESEVRFREWTHEGILRHPAFLHLRTDKAPSTASVRDGRRRGRRRRVRARARKRYVRPTIRRSHRVQRRRRVWRSRT